MSMGKLLTLIGILLVLLGLIISYAPGLVSWFGKLPGDIRLGDDKRVVFIPITSMIIISIVLTLVLNLFFRK